MAPHPSFSDILAPHSERVRALAERLRSVIAAAMPEASEKANPGWHAITYRHPKAGYVCGLFPLDDCVQLVFEFGVLLPDPEGILTGNGRQVRSVMVRTMRDVRVRALRALIAEALALPYERSKRLRLIRAAEENGAR